MFNKSKIVILDQICNKIKPRCTTHAKIETKRTVSASLSKDILKVIPFVNRRTTYEMLSKN